MSLISSPIKAWEGVRLEGRRAVLTVFIYSMVGLCGLSVFIGALWTNGWGGPQSSQLTTTQCCAITVASFKGCLLAAYAINRMGIKMFGMPNNILLAQQFAGYALAITFLLHIATGLLPDSSTIGWLFQFYIAYVVQGGARAVTLVEEKNRLRYTIFSSILSILCPKVIQIVFNGLTTILS